MPRLTAKQIEALDRFDALTSCAFGTWQKRVAHDEGCLIRRTSDRRAYNLSSNYANANGEAHMEDIVISLLPIQIFKDNPPLHLSETLGASGCSFGRVPSGLREVDRHNPPRRNLVIWLTGEVEFETSDGDIRRRVAAGSVVLSEDTTGKRHISRHPPDGRLLVFVDLAERPCSADPVKAVLLILKIVALPPLFIQ